MSILFDSFAGIIQISNKDYFFDDYDTVEELILDIEKNYKLSKHEKEQIRQWADTRDSEDIDNA